MIVAAVTAPGTLLWRRVTKSRSRVGWSVVYDEPINQGDPTTRPRSVLRREPDEEENPSEQARQAEMWKISYEPEGRAEGAHSVENGSLAVLEIRNVGGTRIGEGSFEGRKITCQFPGRKVVHFKIRDNDRYRDIVRGASSGPPVPGALDKFELPATRLNPGESFRVVVLLESPKGTRPERNKKPKVKGGVAGHEFVKYGRLSWRRLWPWIVPGVLVAGVLGLGFGFWWGNGGNDLNPPCASGNLDIEGSTAFAPIANQVATDYEAACPQAHITISASGSIQGLKALVKNKNTATPVIAMYDGTPDPPPGASFTSRPVGVVIFSIVGNRSLPAAQFAAGTNGGMTGQAIAQVFEHPAGTQFHPVGRTPVSGTRAAFSQDVLGGDDASEGAAPMCPASPPPAGHPASGLCLESTTMQLLTYVNQTPGAIGYAESGALSFFPGVGVIPVGGFAPTPGNVKDGRYTFDATEHLYTKGQPTGLTADLIAFLNSKAESDRISDTSGFIPCQDLGDSKITDACKN